MECLNEDVHVEEEEKYDTFCTSRVYRDDLIATNTRLLSIKYEFYGFSGDLDL